ncbi:hypothetical protein GOBAR_DD01239 [Gossypium barbadense]|nr:hypothetical protein GOBAR_DD01239 [Gossypium barbadense]
MNGYFYERMSTKPTSIEGSVIPPTSVDSKNSKVGALSKTKRTTGKRKATPQSQGQLVLPRKGVEGREGHLSTWRFDQEACRKGLTQMIVIEKLPFKFVEKCKRMLCLDVCTRWNSAYLMLDTIQNFERAFKRFEEQDTNFRVELERGEGWPNVDDWATVT